MKKNYEKININCTSMYFSVKFKVFSKDNNLSFLSQENNFKF